MSRTQFYGMRAGFTVVVITSVLVSPVVPIMPSRTVPSHSRNWFSAVLLTLALVGYAELATQPIPEFPITLATTAASNPSTFDSRANSIPEPIISTQSAQVTSCEGIQPLLCAYVNRELVNKLALHLWSPAPNLESQVPNQVSPSATPTAPHFGETIKFLTTCKNWIEDYSGLLDSPHPSPYEHSIALSVEE